MGNKSFDNKNQSDKFPRMQIKLSSSNTICKGVVGRHEETPQAD